jgi:hypothetical protein
MKKLKIYLDTSIVNFLYVNDSPEYRKATEVFFDNVVAKNKVETYISNIVIEEINKTENKVITLNRTLGYYYPFRMANPLEVYFEE